MNVTVSLPSPARLRPASIRQPAASTSAIESPALPCASTAICLASLAKGTPRARPDRAPSALSAMRSFGLAGATVIMPSGEAILACDNSHPASMVSASGTAIAKRPAALSTLKPSARLAPEPPQSSGTHDSGRPASVSACQSGSFQSPFLSRLMVCGVGEIGEYLLRRLRDNVLTLRHSVPRFSIGTPGVPPSASCVVFLHGMMGKSRRHDKRRCPQGSLQGRREASEIRRNSAQRSFADLQAIRRAIW